MSHDKQVRPMLLQALERAQVIYVTAFAVSTEERFKCALKFLERSERCDAAKCVFAFNTSSAALAQRMGQR